MNLFDFLVSREDAKENIYPDYVGIPTIGVGYNLRSPEVLKSVLDRFGYSITSIGRTDFDLLVTKLGEKFEATWTTANTAAKTAEVNAILATYKGKLIAGNPEPRSTFNFIKSNNPDPTKTDKAFKYDMQPVFDTVATDFKAGTVKRFVALGIGLTTQQAQQLVDGLTDSQLIPLVSIAINGGTASSP